MSAVANAHPARRECRFENLDEVIEDVSRLQHGGYTQLGNWDLAGTCNHLAQWMRFPVEGFPKPSLPMAAVLWVMRNTVGPAQLRKVLDRGGFEPGLPTLPVTVHLTGGDATAAVTNLREAATQFTHHPGPWQPSPLFGRLDRSTLLRLQLVHCSHHLSFLIPHARTDGVAANHD